MERREMVDQREVWLSPGGYPPGAKRPGTACERRNPQVCSQNVLALPVRKNRGAVAPLVVDMRSRVP